MSNYVHGGSGEATVDEPLVPPNASTLNAPGEPAESAADQLSPEPDERPKTAENTHGTETSGEGRAVPEALKDLEIAHLAIDTEEKFTGDELDGNLSGDWDELTDESVVEQLRTSEFDADNISGYNKVNVERECELASDQEALADRMLTTEPGEPGVLIAASGEESRFPASVLAAHADLIADIDDLTAQYGTHRSALLPILEGLRDRRHQITDVAMQIVADRLGIAAVDVEGVVTFYHFLGRQPTGRHVIHVCRTISCALQGMEQVVQRLERETGVSMDETTPDGAVTLEWANCVGLCDQAPAILVDREAVGPVTPDQAANIIAMLRP